MQQEKENNGCVRYITDAEETTLRTVITKSHSEHLSEVEVALMTGMRQGQQFSLTWDKVDLGTGVLRLEDTKNSAGRLVRLNTRAVTVLTALRGRDLGVGRVFVLNKKPPLVYRCRKGGRSQGCDMARAAAHVYQSVGDGRVDIRTVMELAGHKSIAITMRYAHLAQGHFIRALQTLCPARELGAISSATTDEETENLVGGCGTVDGQ